MGELAHEGPEPEGSGAVRHSGQVDHVHRWANGGPAGGGSTGGSGSGSPLAPPPTGYSLPRPFPWEWVWGVLALGLVLAALTAAAIALYNWADGDNQPARRSGVTIADVMVQRGVDPDRLRVCGLEKVADGTAWRITINRHFACRDTTWFVLPVGKVKLVWSPRFKRASATLNLPDTTVDPESTKNKSLGVLIQDNAWLATLRLTARFKEVVHQP